MDTVLGLIELVLYVALILALSAGMTFLVIKVLPAQSTKRHQAKDEST